MKANIRIANVAKETGALLREYLRDRGLELNGVRPTICYGIPGAEDDLNGNCGGGDKIRRMRQMDAGGVRTVPWFNGREIPDGFKFPVLARRVAGHGGEDIVPVFQADEVPWRLQAGWSWFSQYVPTATEYRVWMYRDDFLDAYEKVMRRPGDYAYIGRNFRNGFDFEPVKLNYLDEAVSQARKVIHALQFDFGAIDMLRGQDGKIYVLECNTAPGVIKSGAQKTLGKLADHMVDWVKSGSPKRGY